MDRLRTIKVGCILQTLKCFQVRESKTITDFGRIKRSYLPDLIRNMTDNRDDGISDSELYKEVLLSMVLAGVATSIKRTIIALYL